MSWSFVIREPSDGPWRDRQPRFEGLMRLPPGGFGLVTSMPTGESMIVRLGRPPSVDDGWRRTSPKA